MRKFYFVLIKNLNIHRRNPAVIFTSYEIHKMVVYEWIYRGTKYYYGWIIEISTI